MIEDDKRHECPLCPGHLHYKSEFIWNKLLKERICIPCERDFYYAFCEIDEFPTDRICCDESLVKIILERTGLTFPQAKFFYLRDYLTSIRSKLPQSLKTFNPLRASTADLHAWNIKLDAQVYRWKEHGEAVWHDDPTIFSALRNLKRE